MYVRQQLQNCKVPHPTSTLLPLSHLTQVSPWTPSHSCHLRQCSFLVNNILLLSSGLSTLLRSFLIHLCMIHSMSNWNLKSLLMNLMRSRFCRFALWAAWYSSEESEPSPSYLSFAFSLVSFTVWSSNALALRWLQSNPLWPNHARNFLGSNSVDTCGRGNHWWLAFFQCCGCLHLELLGYFASSSYGRDKPTSCSSLRQLLPSRRQDSWPRPR